MTTLVVLFNLKDQTQLKSYEKWAKESDIPTAGNLPSVDKFEVLKSQGLLMGEGEPPYQYIEILRINDMEQLGKDVQTETMQKVASQFQGFADNPTFIITENL